MNNPEFDLSLIIPIYNEAKRINLMIKGLVEFDQKYHGSYELVICDDGCKDNSLEVIHQQDFIKKLITEDRFQIVSQNKNTGKGGALKLGIAAARGHHFLTLDADMAMHPLLIEKWKKQENGKFEDDAIWIASRPHSKSKIEDKKIRKFAGSVFNFFIRLFTGLDIIDTQCGFKLYPARVARKLFKDLKMLGFAHDVEILLNGHLLGIKIKEMPVEVNNDESSTVNIYRDSFKMLFGVISLSASTFVNWCFIQPVKLISGKYQGFIETAKYPSLEVFKRESIFRLLFVSTSILLLFLMPYLSKDYGIAGDEWIQNDYGQKIYDYYFHGDKEVLSEEKRSQGYEKIKYYSGGMELLCAIVYNNIPNSNIWEVRHFINALFGVFLFVFTGLLAKEITGSWTTAYLSLLFLVLSPRIFGHSMNNSKDIPFAASFAMSLLYMLRYVKSLPKPSLRSSILLMFGIAFALNIRIGGLLLYGYLGVFILAFIALNFKKINQSVEGLTGFIKKTALYTFLISIPAFFLGILTWPYALLDPITHMMESLQLMTQFDTVISVLFEGKTVMSNQLPWYYEIKWMLISNPLIVLLAFLIGVFSLPMAIKRFGILPIFVLLFALIFPQAYAIYKESVVYDGWRHFIFIWPIVCIIGAIGYSFLLFNRKNIIKYGSLAVLIIGLALPLKWMISSHPNQLVYFNEAFGGLEKAFGDYETDYYMNSLKQGVDWLVENENLAERKDTVYLASNCYKEVGEYLKLVNPNLKCRYLRYEDRISKDFEYGIFISRFTDKSLIENNWPPEDLVLHNVKEDGVTLTTVFKKKSNKDYLGYQALRNGNVATAISLFNQYLETDPKNEVVWQYLGDAYASAGNSEEALKAYNECLKLHKGNLQALEKMGKVFIEQQKFDAALKVYQRMIEYHPASVQGYYYAAIVHLNKGNAALGIQFLNKSIEVQPNFRQGYLTLANVYRQQGNEGLANQYQQMANELGR